MHLKKLCNCGSYVSNDCRFWCLFNAYLSLVRKNSAELGIPIGPISAGGSAGGTPWVSTKNDLMGECSMGFSTSLL